MGRPPRHCSAPHTECASLFPSPVYPNTVRQIIQRELLGTLLVRVSPCTYPLCMHVVSLSCECTRYCYKVIRVPLFICRAELAVGFVPERLKDKSKNSRMVHTTEKTQGEKKKYEVFVFLTYNIP